MQTLLIISASAFALAAFGWFITWAVCIHAPEGWVGKQIVSAMPIPETEAVRHAGWFRWLKIVTLLLGLATLALISMMVAAYS